MSGPSSSIFRTKRFQDPIKPTQTDISILTGQLEKQHGFSSAIVQGGYRWIPERDTLGDLIREYEALRGI